MLAALAVILVTLGVWFGLLLLSPGDDSNRAAASASTEAGEHTTHAGPQGAVADRLRSDEQSVGFCVSAALEPFAGAVAQIREIGPAETGERFRRCLLDTMFDHATDATLAEIETHRPHFTDCFGELAARDDTDKSDRRRRHP